ncbi:hypothetical protein DFH09DRAFT_1407122 [Mycena vulgaris]|nr:hypothetical protein DFH09DRAFT_1407122 [Mycena vulgaris]
MHEEIVLPSIRDLFPEHLRTVPSAVPRSFVPATSEGTHTFSCDVPTSGPLASSSQQISPHRAVSLGGSSNGNADMDGDDNDDEEDEGKKHICANCGKRLKRTGSLRAHANMHTGAMPFKCPHAGCGYAFSVNSNTRGHLGNASVLPTAGRVVSAVQPHVALGRLYPLPRGTHTRPPHRTSSPGACDTHSASDCVPVNLVSPVTPFSFPDERYRK